MSLTVPRISRIPEPEPRKTLRKRDPRRWHDTAAEEVGRQAALAGAEFDRHRSQQWRAGWAVGFIERKEAS